MTITKNMYVEIIYKRERKNSIIGELFSIVSSNNYPIYSIIQEETGKIIPITFDPYYIEMKVIMKPKGDNQE